MVKCQLCNSKVGERECLKRPGNKICTLCCGSNRSWENCPTTCDYIKKEVVPEFFIAHAELMNESTGEGIRFIANCYLPNVYELVTCHVQKFEWTFLDSQSINVSLTVVLESPRNILPEIYLKDCWKKDENWGDQDLSENICPLIFLFGKENSVFSLASTTVKTNNSLNNINQSLIHWNIWTPFSKLCLETLRSPVSPDGKYTIRDVRAGEGRYFIGKNLAIFSNIALNTPIEINTIIRYNKTNLIPGVKKITTCFGILLPFKKVVLNGIELNSPYNFSIGKSTIELLSPMNGKMRQEYLIPITSENERVLSYGNRELSVELPTTLSIEDFRLLQITSELVTDSEIEALAFVTSFPIPTSIYNEINKLPFGNISIAHIVLTNFSDKPQKIHATAEIQGFSYPYNAELVINPWGQNELKITPALIDDRIIGLYNDTDANLSIIVECEGRTILRKNVPIRLLSRNIMIWNIEDPGSSWHIRLWDLIGAWVTPNIPEIRAIISDVARECGTIRGPSTYQLGDQAIEREVKGFYDVISRDIRYVNTPSTFGDNGSLLVQRVSTPKETLMQKGGNCIELSLLFASCLESCGIKPLIVMIPGHAFVGWKGNNKEYFIEATYMGKNKTFYEACREGSTKYQKYFPKGNHIESENGYSRVVDIEEIRNRNILPIRCG